MTALRKTWLTWALCLVLALSFCAAQAESSVLSIEDGTTNKEVYYLQQLLQRLGYMDSDPDGIYGERTRSAAASYCVDRGLDPAKETGLSLLKGVVTDEGELTNAGIEQNRLAVYVVQRHLNQWGFLADAADGAFGSNTRSALKSFMEYARTDMAQYLQQREDARAEQVRQSNATLPPEMQVPEDVRLITPDSTDTDGELTVDWYDFITNSGYTPTGKTVLVGEKNADALRIQKRLNRLGYLASGIDGNYGANSALAMKYFQRRNGLLETGNADVDTQKVLFSDAAKESDCYVAPYMAYVSTSKNKVRIMGWDGDGYNREVKVFTCTTGAKKTPTIKGTFQAAGQAGEWYEMKKSHCWVRYAFIIDGGYFFHSLLYGYKGDPSPSRGSVANLGHNASHGCVRLALEDAKWLYENCTPGMTVVIS